jgi:hypothetical protein
MTRQETRSPSRTPAIPRPRAHPQDEVETTAPVGDFPWPEPWHASPGARPRSEYWDVATASWHSRGPLFPRHSD